MMTAKAIKFAEEKHAGQFYGTEPYIVHCNAVAAVLIRFGLTGETLLSAAILHDVIEDTQTNYNDIEAAFNKEVAEIVYCVTDELGRNREERKEKTYPKIRNNHNAILVKLADRIANVENAIASSNTVKLDLYKKEINRFMHALYIDRVTYVDESSTEYKMWFHLAKLFGLERKLANLIEDCV